LFWQGSITHRKDIEILERPIDQLNKIASKIKMVMAGYHKDEDEWYSMALTYTAQTKHQYKLIEGAPVARYYEGYKHADICLVPLVKSKFNGYKSNLKVLEAANLGLPVIASMVDPYLNMPLLYAKCGSDWVKHITRLVNSKKRRKEAGAELKEFCDTHYNFHKINNERKQILEYEAKKVSV
jgi:glycosyltransferase involved in cell wall biosynthesis